MLKIVAKPTLPKETFQAEAKPELLAQAVRVYLANQRQGTQSALTRAQVNRTRRKLYRQKGTGGARHGDRKAPIFVGGGIVFAPKPRDYSLKLPGSVREKALRAALSQKTKEGKITVVSGLSKVSGKTKEIAKFLGTLGLAQNWLIVTDVPRENVFRAARNIANTTILPQNQLNTYEVLKAERIIFMEEALENLLKPKPKKETPVRTVKPVKTVKSPKKSTRKIAKTTAKKVSKPKK